MTRADAVRSYYDAIDAGDYDALASLLCPDFVQRRPDRTLRGREAFVSFMRDDRPRTDTIHVVDGVYRPVGDGVELDANEVDGDGGADGGDGGDGVDGDDGVGGDGRGEGDEIVIKGRLLTESGEELFAFVDVFRLDEEHRLAELRTFSA